MSGRVWNKSRTLKFRAQISQKGASICLGSLLQLRLELAVRQINQRLAIPETFWNWVLCPKRKGGHHYLFTARKRSLGQGNVFTGVCLSTGGLCMMSLPVWLPSLMFLAGGVFVQMGFSVQGVTVQGVSLRGTLPYGGEQALRILLECFLVVLCRFALNRPLNKIKAPKNVTQATALFGIFQRYLKHRENMEFEFFQGGKTQEIYPKSALNKFLHRKFTSKIWVGKHPSNRMLFHQAPVWLQFRGDLISYPCWGGVSGHSFDINLGGG